jgi:hypothetical protein
MRITAFTKKNSCDLLYLEQLKNTELLSELSI